MQLVLGLDYSYRACFSWVPKFPLVEHLFISLFYGGVVGGRAAPVAEMTATIGSNKIKTRTMPYHHGARSKVFAQPCRER